MVDNLKSAVLKRVVGQAPVFNPRYLDFSRHYGFDIAACNVAKATKKAASKMASVMSKRTSSMAWISPISVPSIRRQQWLDSVANVRIHGETHEQPIVRLKLKNNNGSR